MAKRMPFTMFFFIYGRHAVKKPLLYSHYCGSHDAFKHDECPLEACLLAVLYPTLPTGCKKKKKSRALFPPFRISSLRSWFTRFSCSKSPWMIINGGSGFLPWQKTFMRTWFGTLRRQHSVLYHQTRLMNWHQSQLNWPNKEKWQWHSTMVHVILKLCKHLLRFLTCCQK